MIIEERRDPRDETEHLRVLAELFPEDEFRALVRECGSAITDARGDEVDAVVSIPVLEAMFVFEVLARRCS
jgi:hypothetical protein